MYVRKKDIQSLHNISQIEIICFSVNRSSLLFLFGGASGVAHQCHTDARHGLPTKYCETACYFLRGQSAVPTGPPSALGATAVKVIKMVVPSESTHGSFGVVRACKNCLSLMVKSVYLKPTKKKQYKEVLFFSRAVDRRCVYNYK